MKNSFFAGLLSLTIMISCQPDKQLTNYVNPLLGTATLWETKDLGYERHLKTRTWGAEVFPGSSVPNAMVQLSPVTQFRSGAGYQYEDTVIYGFSHTNKGHWNLLHLPVLPVTGNVSSGDYASTYSHSNESARPGYYQVFLERYGVNAELTSTLRCAYHKYTFRPDDDKKVLVDITRTNNGVRDWSIQKVDDYTFSGNQDAEGNIRFYAVSNYKIEDIRQLKNGEHEVSVVSFADSKGSKPLELKIGFSFVSIDNAKMNLEQEMKDNDIKPENGVYGSDVPDGLCYQWAEEYFRDPDAKEDQQEEEKFVPKPYSGKSSGKSKRTEASVKKGIRKEKSGKKSEKKPQEKTADSGSFEQMTLAGLAG